MRIWITSETRHIKTKQLQHPAIRLRPGRREITCGSPLLEKLLGGEIRISATRTYGCSSYDPHKPRVPSLIPGPGSHSHRSRSRIGRDQTTPQENNKKSAAEFRIIKIRFVRLLRDVTRCFSPILYLFFFSCKIYACSRARAYAHI